MPKSGVAPDGLAVRGGETGEGAAELGELGVEVVDLGLGEDGRELGEGSFGLFVSLKGGQTSPA